MSELIKNEYDNLSLILTEDNFQQIAKIKEDLLFANKVNIQGRTESQLRYSVLNKNDCPTVDAEYWQATRELSAMFQSFLSASRNLEHSQLDIEESEVELEILETVEMPEKLKRIKIRKKELEIEAKKEGLERSNHALNKQMQEFLTLYNIWKEKRSELEYSDLNPDEHQIEAILLKCVLNLEVIFLKGEVEYAEIAVYLGMLKSFKEGAIKYGILEKIKQKLTPVQINILEEKFMKTIK